VQPAPATVWSIAHGFGRYPLVNVLDSAGTQVLGEVFHADADNLIVRFSSPFSGRVLLT